MATFDPLRAGLAAFKQKQLDGMLAGLKGAAAGVTLEMRSDPAHGDVTGASHANYTAYAVGHGANGSSEVAHAISAVEALNPGHSAQSSVNIGAELGVIITSFTDYQVELETENAGQKAVIGPTTAASGERFTRAAADGARR